MLAKGLDRVFQMHEVAAGALRSGLMGMGLEIFPDCSKCDSCTSSNKFCSNVVTTFKYPPKVKAEEVEKIMGEKYNLSLLASPYRPECFQLGTINELQLSPDYVLKLVATLGLTMEELGLDIRLENGIRKAYETICK
jgi:aspartate aminotransferase-like enzyme